MEKKYYTEPRKRVFTYIIAIFIVIFAILLLKYSKEVSISIIASINSCLGVIIPSLFGFMVVSNILIKSNIYIIISKPFYLISKYLFRIPPELFSIFLLSNIGGFPIGVSLICVLLKDKKIKQTDANSMICYCYCSGPAFIIGIIGVEIFSNVLVGFLIYLSILFSNILLAIILGLKNKIPENVNIKKAIKLNANILTESIENTAKALSLICGMIIFFSAVIAIINKIGLISKLSQYFSSIAKVSTDYSKIFVQNIFEISTISQLPHYCYKYIPIITIMISLGGICVLMQIAGIVGNKINFKKFIITRPFQIVFSSIFSYFLINLFAKEIVIMTLFKPIVNTQTRNSILPGICIIIMTILLLCKNNSRFLKGGVL